MNKKIFLNGLIIFLLTVITRIIPSTLELLTTDSCTYLDIARNISEGKGFLTSYNCYQFWPGVFYPALVYVSPIFSLLLAIVWRFSHSIQSATLLNVFISGLNCVVLYLILENIYKNTKISFWSAVIVSICGPMFLTSINLWAEQLYLLFLFITILIFLQDFSLKYSRMFLIGIILGFSFFIKASLYNLFAFIIFLPFGFKFNKRTIFAIFLILAGFTMVVLPYELFCLMKFNIAYPAYFKVNTIGYLKARLIGGTYDIERIPVLQANPASFHFKLDYNLRMIPLWLGVTLKIMFKDIGLLIFFLVLRLMFVFCFNNNIREIRRKENFLILLAMVHFILNALTIYWHPWFSITEVRRFNLIPYIFFIPLALASFYNMGNFFKDDVRIQINKIYYIGIIFIFVVALSFMRSNYYTNIGLYRTKSRLRQKAFSWIRQNSSKDQIIATSEIQEAFELNRPIVSLPEKKILTPSNMRKFLEIYHPRYILFANTILPKYKNMLSDYVLFTPREKAWSKVYSVYKLRIERR